MKKLILLSGMHKTGTTSIQTACGNILEVLASSGFLYPLMGPLNSDGSFPKYVNHSDLLTPIFKKRSASSYYKNPNPDEFQRYDIYRKQLRDSFKKHLEANQTDLLLIAEECSLLSPEELLDLKDFFKSLNFEIQVYCCIRGPASWLTSMISQQVIGKRSQRLIISNIVKTFFDAGGIIRSRIQKIEAAFPTTIFYSFNDAISHKSGPAGYFLNFLGISLNDSFSSVKENIGGSDHGVRLNNEINKTLGNRHQFKGNDIFYTTLPLKYPALFEIPGNKFRLRESEVHALLPYLIKENEWLKNTFGVEFCDQEITFNNDPIVINDETSQFLIDKFGSAEQPIKQIVEAYLANHALS